jgi:hypothetical protein
MSESAAAGVKRAGLKPGPYNHPGLRPNDEG